MLSRSHIIRSLFVLCGAIWAGPVSAVEPPPIMSAAAIRAMSPAEASLSNPVLIQGVVVQGLRVGPKALVLWDGREAIYIVVSENLGDGIRHGDLIEIEGVTSPGAFAPIIEATGVKILGQSELPPPAPTTVSEVAAGGLDAHWVELEAIVHSYTRVDGGSSGDSASVTPGDRLGNDPTWILEIAGHDSRIRLRLEADVDVASLLDARVRFTGVCYSVHNANRQFVQGTMVVTGSEFVEVVTAAPAIESLPVTSANGFLQFSQSGFSGHRVKIQGMVTHYEPGRTLWIRDDDRGLEIATAEQTPVEPGDLVEIVGFAEHGNYAPRLRDAVYRVISRANPPSPIRIGTPGESIVQEANLIELEGELLETRVSEEGYFLNLAWHGETFQAVMVAREGEALPELDLTHGSRLRLAGICTRLPQSWSPQIGIWQIDEFQILLRSADDIVVLSPGPWLTEKRAITLLASSAGLLLLLIFAIVVSARRAIARRGVERQMAETEFSAMLKERNRVARDIHDTLAQGLNAVSMQLELAKNASGLDAQKSKTHVVTAHEIVRSCIAEARESIWNMRSHVLDQTDLPGALEIVLRQLGAAHAVLSRVEVEGERRRLAPTIENDLLRVGQEAIANALKHAEASNVVVRVVFMPASIRLEVLDDGGGFELPTTTDPSSRFGLKGMRERIEQMQGILRIRRRVEGGTEVVVEWGQTDHIRQENLRNRST